LYYVKNIKNIIKTAEKQYIIYCIGVAFIFVECIYSIRCRSQQYICIYTYLYKTRRFYDRVYIIENRCDLRRLLNKRVLYENIYNINVGHYSNIYSIIGTYVFMVGICTNYTLTLMRVREKSIVTAGNNVVFCTHCTLDAIII